MTFLLEEAPSSDQGVFLPVEMPGSFVMSPTRHNTTNLRPPQDSPLLGDSAVEVIKDESLGRRRSYFE